jgi:DNA helicase-2/ATP-dependent DNA helicase PcrA
MRRDKIDFLKELNPQQYEAVVNIRGPLMILAGPGTGKTRVIAYKIAYLLEVGGIQPENIFAVTFTNKAADEMRSRVVMLCGERGKNVNVSTFHSWGVRFLRHEIKYTNLKKNFTVYDENDQRQLIREVMKLCNVDERKYSVGYIADKINNAKDNLLDAESYFIHSMLSSSPEAQMLATVYKKYQEKLQEYNAVDFGDLILKPVEILRDNKEVLKKYQNKIEYILVDEYQDTNHAQYVLTKYLAGKHRNISIVGDEDQAIYSWRGADFKNLWKFEKDFPETKIIKLEYNYRSIPEIIDVAQHLIKYNKLRKEKENKPVRLSNEDCGVIYHQTPNERAEAEYVGCEIKSLVREKKYKYSDIAVFYRLNAQSRVLEDVFLLKEKIPYTIVGNISFYQRKEIKDILAYLKVVYNPKDSLSLRRIINTPTRGIGKSTLAHVEKFMEENSVDLYTALLNVRKIAGMNYNVVEKIESFASWIQELHEKAPYMSLKKIVYNILEYTRYIEELELEGTRDAKEKIRNIEELVTKVSEFESSANNNKGRAALENFLSYASLSTDVDLWEENRRNAVTLMTLHLAKGLEFPVVFIVGLEEELFPLLSLEENIESEAALEELEEERRLCYVGITRAKERLYLTSAIKRNMFGVMVYRRPSRFIMESGVNTKRSVYKVKYSKDVETQFHVGDRVRHPIFGIGTVVNCASVGEDLRIIVKFEDGSWRKFVAKFAKLEKI